MTKSRLVVAAAIAGVMAFVFALCRTDEAVRIVKAAMEAHGGEEALRRNRSGEIGMSGTITLFGGRVEYRGELFYEMPDKYSMTTAVFGNGRVMTMTQTANGGRYRSSIGGARQALDETTKSELEYGVVSQHVWMLYPLLDGTLYTISAEEDGAVAGVACSTILVEGNRAKPIRVHFDKGTGLLRAITRKAPEPGAQAEVEEECLLIGYKEVGGIRVPTETFVSRAGKTVATSRNSVLPGQKIDPKVFAVDD